MSDEITTAQTEEEGFYVNPVKEKRRDIFCDKCDYISHTYDVYGIYVDICPEHLYGA